jgi:hypothetical protein|tara:strand:- start:119 stop:310 length:192 start_codon:yes stop_codon:yes gene_type:complete
MPILPVVEQSLWMAKEWQESPAALHAARVASKQACILPVHFTMVCAVLPHSQCAFLHPLCDMH